MRAYIQIKVMYKICTYVFSLLCKLAAITAISQKLWISSKVSTLGFPWSLIVIKYTSLDQDDISIKYAN